MNTIKVTPDFDHPLEQHSLDYEEVFDVKQNAFKIALVTNMNMGTRWKRKTKEERTLEDAVRISAKTTEVLLALGMDLEKDDEEQREWFEQHPPKIFRTETNRIPPGTPAVEIFRLMHIGVRNEVYFNTNPKYNLKEGLYKEVIDNSGRAVKKPLLGMELTYNGKKIKPRWTKSSGNTLACDARLKINAPPPLPPQDIYTSAVGSRLSALLNEYDRQVVKDAVQLRTYITNKLLEISNCGTPKDELRALELLGKISDVGLFVEKSEVNITHTTAAALEHSIKDKINRILGRSGVSIEDAEFKQVTNPELIYKSHEPSRSE